MARPLEVFRQFLIDRPSEEKLASFPVTVTTQPLLDHDEFWDGMGESMQEGMGKFPRVHMSLPTREAGSDTQGWFRQVQQGNCGVYAFYNAVHRMNEDVHQPVYESFFSDLERWIDWYGSFESDIAGIVMKKHPDLPVSLGIVKIRALGNRIGPLREKAVINSAQKIAKSLDKGNKLLVEVRGGALYKHADEEIERHARGNGHVVAISDYRVSQDGLMDVYVVDPAYGRLWLPLEGFLRSMHIVGMQRMLEISKKE